MNITGGKFNSRKVTAPKADTVRPTLSKIRQSVFNSISNLIDFETASFLDLFSGSGIISLEAISRGFEKVISVEKDLKTANIIKGNFSTLGLKPNLLIKDAISFLKTTDENFDVIYIDPPYDNKDLYQQSITLIAENEILKNNGLIIVEYKKGQKLFDVPKEFNTFKEKTYGDTGLIIFTVL